MKKTCLIAAAALLLPVAGARAQDARELTLSAAIEAALRAHPAVELASASADRARSSVREARAAQLPSLHLDGHATRFEEPMVVAPIHALDPNNLPQFDRTLMQGSVSLNYALFDAARGPRVERARALAAAAETAESGARTQTIAETARLWLRLRSARETRLAHEHRVRALDSETARAAQLVEQGRAARVVQLRAEAALSGARADLAASAAVETDALRELARQMNVSADALAGVTLPHDTHVARGDTAIDQLREAARNAPEIQRLLRQVEAAEAQRGEAKALLLPRVMAGGRFVEYAGAEATPQGEWQAGLQFTYPLLTGGSRKAAQDRASADVRIARAELELVTRRIDDAIDRSITAYAAATSRVNAFASAVAQSEEIVRIEKLSLSEGAGVQTDYLLAEADLFRARAGLTEAHAQVVLAMVELARLTGQLSPQWIATHVESGR